MMARIPAALRLLAVLLVQAGAIGWMIYDRAQILLGGAEIRLKTEPADPRDLFRGHYATLRYSISLLRTPLLEGDDEFAAQERVHVVLAPADDGLWQAVSVHRAPVSAGPGRVVIAGRIEQTYTNLPMPADWTGPPCPAPCATLAVEYGIESYFAPKKEAQELEKIRNDGKVEVLAAVAADGRAAIKVLIVDGTLRYTEPLL